MQESLRHERPGANRTERVRAHRQRPRADEEISISQRLREDEAPRGTAPDDVAHSIDQALRLGWSGHFDLARTLLVSLRDRPEATHGERALCRALLALASAALSDLPAARKFARQAVHDTARPVLSMKPDRLRELQLARALAVNAGELVGDRVRARRAAQVRFMAGDALSTVLMNADGELPWQDAPSAVRRYARFVAAVHLRVQALRPPGILTPAELGILRHLAAGTSVRRIAGLLGRSEHTIRTHLRNSYPKLGAHRRDEALSRAGLLGLLDP